MNNQPLPQQPTQTQQAPETLEQIVHDLHVDLPIGNLPLPVKIIALLTSVGGLSITASVLTDIVNPAAVSVWFHFLRFCVGILMLAISYGIIRRRRWSLWAYGFVVAVGFFINPALAFIPVAILVYLYFQRQLFVPSVLDRYWDSFAAVIRRALLAMSSKQ